MRHTRVTALLLAVVTLAIVADSEGGGARSYWNPPCSEYSESACVSRGWASPEAASNPTGTPNRATACSALPDFPGPEVSGFIVGEQSADARASDTILLTMVVAGTGTKRPLVAGEVLTLHKRLSAADDAELKPRETLASLSPRRILGLLTGDGQPYQWCFEGAKGKLRVVFTSVDAVSAGTKAPGPTISPWESSAPGPTIFRVARVTGVVVAAENPGH